MTRSSMARWTCRMLRQRRTAHGARMSSAQGASKLLKAFKKPLQSLQKLFKVFSKSVQSLLKGCSSTVCSLNSKTFLQAMGAPDAHSSGTWDLILFPLWQAFRPRPRPPWHLPCLLTLSCSFFHLPGFLAKISSSSSSAKSGAAGTAGAASSAGVKRGASPTIPSVSNAYFTK